MRRTLIAVLVASLGVTACSIDVEGNPDGSLRVQRVMMETDMQDSHQHVIADPNADSLTREFHAGYATVAATGKDEETGEVHDISFEVRLSVVDGHLGAEISEGLWNGYEIPEWIVDAWNKAIARQLEAEGRKDPNSELVAVSLSDDALTMEWRVED